MHDIDRQTQRRDRSRSRLATVGELRPGTLSENNRKCCKPGCRRAEDVDPGHSHSHFLNRSVDEKRSTVRNPPDEVDRTRGLLR